MPLPDLRDETRSLIGAPASVDAVAAYLDHENDVVRCAALRAFAATAPEREVREALLTALTDLDPDIRFDAMARLERRARPEDAAALRASLEGDPVREVKLAAIRALVAIDDRASVDLLRRLVLSRCEGMVAWEDEDSDWDDWLDVQVAAVVALGRLRATETIEDLVAARKDEFGQNLDVAVFDAFGRMGVPGIGALLHILETEQGPAARRAAVALAATDVEVLAPYIDSLLISKDPDVRVVALNAVSCGDPRIFRLAVSDPSEDVRRCALRHVAGTKPEAVEVALHDASEQVQAEALLLLRGNVSPRLREALVDNMFLWLRQAGPSLAKAAAEALPQFAPNRCEAPLIELIADTERPLEARVAAVMAMAEIAPPPATDTFAGILRNPARQVRAAALAQLARRAKGGDDTAVDVIVETIRGERVVASLTRPHEDERCGSDIAMPKGESEPRRLKITREGGIVEGEEATAGSTLHEIMSADPASGSSPSFAEDTPEEGVTKPRKRRPVEGSDDFVELLEIDAIRLCGPLPVPEIEAALLTCVSDSRDHIRQSAWTALAQWPSHDEHSVKIRAAAISALRDPDPRARLAAFDILSRQELPKKWLTHALEDGDALLRAKAIGQLAPEAALDFLADDAPAVRMAAAARAVDSADPAVLNAALDVLINTGRIDTLGLLFRESEDARKTGIRELSKIGSNKKALVVLEALSRMTQP